MFSVYLIDILVSLIIYAKKSYNLLFLTIKNIANKKLNVVSYNVQQYF